MLKATFLSLFGPDSLCRNLIVILVTVVVKWAEGYWAGAPELTQHAFVILLVFYIVDTISGGAVALKQGRFSSEAFRKGLWKFVAYGTSIITGIGLDYLLMGYVMQENYVVATVMVGIAAVNEASSIMENSGKLGFPWPKRVRDMMAKLKASCSGDEEGETT